MKNLIIFLCFVFLNISVFANDFSDVPKDHWAYNSIAKCRVFQGYADETFQGNKNITRYEFALSILKILSIYEKKNDIIVNNFEKTNEINGIKKEEIENLIKLVNEFSKELTEIGVDVNDTKSELENLREKVILIEEETKRVKINGSATFFYKTNFQDEVVDKALDKKSSFSKDFQIDLKGRVTDDINVNLSLVAGDYILKNISGYSKLWTTQVNYSSMSLLPYYAYSNMNFDTLNVQLGRLPMQINKYVFKRYDNDTYTNLQRMDNGDYSVDGIDLNKKLDNFNVRAYLFKPQKDMFYDPTMYGIKGNMFGLGNTIKMFTGGEVSYNNKSLKITGLYSKIKSDEDNKAINRDVNSADLYGGTLDYEKGNFFFDSAYYIQHTPNLYESGLYPIKYNNKAQMIAANFTYKNKGFNCGAGFKEVEQGYLAPGDWEAMGTFHNFENIKGPTFNANYQVGKWLFKGLFNNYKARNKELAPNDERTRYITLGVDVDTNPFGLLGLKYEDINRIGQKVGVLTFSYKKYIGNAYLKLGYQNMDVKFENKIYNYFFGQVTYTF